MFSFLRLSYSLRVKKILVDAVQKIASKQKDTTEIVSKHGYIRKVRDLYMTGNRRKLLAYFSDLP